MKETTVMLDALADKLERRGYMKLARALDIVSNTLEAADPNVTEVAPPTYMPEMRQHVPPTVPKRAPTPWGGPKPIAGEIIAKNRDSIDSHLNAVESSLKAVGGLVEDMSKEAVKAYPQRAGGMEQNIVQGKKRLSTVYQQVKDAILQELKNFLVTAGGVEEASSFSIDHLRLAAKKAIDKAP